MEKNMSIELTSLRKDLTDLHKKIDLLVPKSAPFGGYMCVTLSQFFAFSFTHPSLTAQAAPLEIPTSK